MDLVALNRASLDDADQESSNCAFCRLLQQRGKTVETCSHLGQVSTHLEEIGGSNLALRHLFNAAALGDLERVDWLMLSGVDVSQRDRYQLTPLHFAASQGRMAVVEFLVAMTKGATINSRDAWGFTPIDCALNNGQMHIVDFLQKNNAQMKHNDSPLDQLGVKLCALAASGNLDEIKTLGENGVDLSTGDYDNRTALHLAAAEGHLHIVNYLLAREEVDVNVVDRLGFTPLQYAEKSKSNEVILALKKRGVDKSLASKSVLSYRLMDACNHGDLEEVTRLVEDEHADVNACDYDGRVPLHVACLRGHESVVRYLLSQGATADAIDRWGSDPFEESLKMSHHHIAELLDSKGHMLMMHRLPLDHSGDANAVDPAWRCCERFGDRRESFHRALKLALRHVCRTRRWAYGEIWVVDPKLLALRCCRDCRVSQAAFDAYANAVQSLLIESSSFFSSAPVRRGKSLWLADLGQVRQSTFIGAPMARAAGLRSCVAVPVRLSLSSGDDDVLCHAVLLDDKEREFDASELAEMEKVFSLAADILVSESALRRDEVSRSTFIESVNALLHCGDDEQAAGTRTPSSLPVPFSFAITLLYELEIIDEFFVWGSSVNSEDHKAAINTLCWLANKAGDISGSLQHDILSPLSLVLKFLSTVSPFNVRDSVIQKRSEDALASLRKQGLLEAPLQVPYFDVEHRSPIYDHIDKFRNSIDEVFNNYSKREQIEALSMRMEPDELKLSVGEVFEACGSRSKTSSPWAISGGRFSFSAQREPDESDRIATLGTKLLRDSRTQPFVTVANLRSLHSMLNLHDSTAGELRRMRVVGSHLFYKFYRVFAPAEEVGLLLDMFERDMNGPLKKWNAVQRAFYAFGCLVMFIHPFEDGNGRVGRIFANMILKTEGYNTVFDCNVKVATFEEILDMVVAASEHRW